MDIDLRHNNLRHKLDTLGFCQPLPLGSVGLVSAILDDLIKTTESLKDAKGKISHLLEEKEAWELGVEPYKCDNSKLLAECSNLNLDIIKQKDHYELKRAELNRRIRNLELDKKYLEEHCSELGYKIRELELKLAETGCLKSKKDGANMNKKPFISTVRSGYILPSTIDVSEKCHKCHCPINVKKPDSSFELQKLQNELQNQAELLETFKKQIDTRDREIKRLSELLSGGRPPTALARDCCYKGVGNLAEDVEILQKEKTATIVQLKDALRAQHEAMERAIDLAKENEILKKEFKDLEDAALSVESQANKTCMNKDKENLELKSKCNEMKQLIKNLEDDLQRARKDDVVDGEKLKVKLKKTQEDKKRLCEEYKLLSSKNKTLNSELEQLKKRHTKVKTKLANFQSGETHKIEGSVVRDSDDDIRPLSNLNEDLKRYKSERDYFQKEYLMLMEKVQSNPELDTLRSKLSEREKEISNLISEMSQLRNDVADNKFDTGGSIRSMTNRSIQTSLHRIERERDVAKNETELLRMERDNLREKLMKATQAQMLSQDNYEKLLHEINQRIRKLEEEKMELLSAQGPTNVTMSLLKNEVQELRTKVNGLQSENSSLKSTNSQLKILHDQTEKAFIAQQNKIIHSENQLGQASTKLSLSDMEHEQLKQEIANLKEEIASSRNDNVALERDKDKLLVELDQKTEKLFNMEMELKQLKINKRDLEGTMDQLKMRLEQQKSETLQRDAEIRGASTETDSLRKQVAMLKRNSDNAMAENGRILDEMSQATAELTLTRKKLKESQKEVEGLKLQLQQYVQEVQRAENLLMKKEQEREEMLEHFQSLSHDAVILEGTNHSLEAESAETKKALGEAEDKMCQMAIQLSDHEHEIQEYEKQVATLSSQVHSLETQLEDMHDENSHLKNDLDAVKILCDKLDLQKDKLNDELTELATIRQQLERENEQIRGEMKLLRKPGDKAAADSLQELLATSRSDMEQQRITINNLNQELSRLRIKVKELQDELDGEKMLSKRNEALAHEYSVQLQELRQELTNDRFAQIRSRDEQDSLNRPESGNKVSFNYKVQIKCYSDTEEVVQKHQLEKFRKKKFRRRSTSPAAGENDEKILANLSTNLLVKLYKNVSRNDLSSLEKKFWKKLLKKTPKESSSIDRHSNSKKTNSKNQNKKNRDRSTSVIVSHEKKEKLITEPELEFSSKSREKDPIVKSELIKLEQDIVEKSKSKQIKSKQKEVRTNVDDDKNKKIISYRYDTSHLLPPPPFPIYLRVEMKSNRLEIDENRN